MRDGGRPVGAYRLDLPMPDNLDLVELALGGATRRTSAAATAGSCSTHALAAGRRARPAPGDRRRQRAADGPQNRAMRFAAAAGASRSLGEMRRALDLTALDRDRLAALRAEAERAADGYQLVSWTGPCPDDLVDDYAAADRAG